MTTVLSLSAQADLIREYLKANDNKLEWSKMLAFSVPAGYEQEDWMEILQTLPLEAFKEAGNTRISGYPLTAIKDIRTQHHKKPMAISGKIIGLSDVMPDAESMGFRCLNCSVVTEASNGKPPKKCMACGAEELEADIANARNVQVYRIQEGNLMMSLVAKEEDLLYQTKPGHNVYGFGVLKFKQVLERGIVAYRKFLELANIVSKTNNDINLTAEDIERFTEMVKDPLHYQILVESWAPQLHGLMEAKELCMIVTASMGIKRPLNGFLGGPPATGKTELIIYSTRITRNGQFVNTMNMTQAGLTSAAVTDPETGMLMTRIGLLAAADGDLAGITEFQAIANKPQEKVGLNDVLERKEVAGSKADGTIRLPARCAVLIDSNNYRASWDYSLSLAENLKYLQPNVGAFLSRMDLITVTERITDPETLKAIAGANYDASLDKEDPLEQFMDDWEDEQGIPHYGVNTMRKYIAYVTSLPLPPLDKELKETFQNNYVEAHEENSDFLVDGRYNRSILTIAKVRARLLLKPQVDKSDLLEAIRMVNRSKDIETKTAEGRDSGVLLGVKDKQKLNQEDQFWELFTKLTKPRDEMWHDKLQTIEYVSESELQYELVQNLKWPEGKARKYIGSLKKNCLVLETYGAGKLTKA